MPIFTLLKIGLLSLVFLSLLLIVGRLLLQRKFTVFASCIIGLTGLGLLIAFDAFYVEPGWIQVTRVTFKNERLKEIVKDVKIVQITDWHINEGVTALHRQMIKKVNALKPDLIFVTGDFFDDLTQVKYAQDVLKQLKPAIGMYGVPGNTDHISMDSDSLERALEPFGINILVNESISVPLPSGHRLQVVGVDDPKYRFGRLKDAVHGVDFNKPYILLAHGPDIFDEAVQIEAPVVLVGDTHGGQVGIEFLVRMSDYANRSPYMKGMYHEGKTSMYVNRGIGMKTLPIRFLCRPEIAVIKFK